MSATDSKPFRILALDGGGLGPLYTSQLLIELCGGKNLDVGKGFDLILGASTGGILATALAAGVSLERVQKFFFETGDSVFSKRMPNSRVSSILSTFSPSAPLRRQEKLREELTELFGDETMISLFRRRGVSLCVPAVNLTFDNYGWVFKTAHDATNQRDNEYRLVDVCMATSAMPGFLPPVLVADPQGEVPSGHWFVDGGLWASNSVLASLAMALVVSEKRPLDVISIGACPRPYGPTLTSREIGRLVYNASVSSRIMEASINSHATSSHYIADKVTKKFNQLGLSVRFSRLESKVPVSDTAQSTMGLDQGSERAMNVLVSLGREDGSREYSEAFSKRAEKSRLVAEVFGGLNPLI